MSPVRRSWGSDGVAGGGVEVVKGVRPGEAKRGSNSELRLLSRVNRRWGEAAGEGKEEEVGGVEWGEGEGTEGGAGEKEEEEVGVGGGVSEEEDVDWGAAEEEEEEEREGGAAAGEEGGGGEGVRRSSSLSKADNRISSGSMFQKERCLNVVNEQKVEMQLWQFGARTEPRRGGAEPA